MPSATLTTCLWFNGTDDPLDAAKFYTSIFPNSSISHIQRYTNAASQVHGHTDGEIMTISFTLNTNSFVILNGGPHPNAMHNDAVSFIIECKDQDEIDYYYDKLDEGGDEARKNCGWVADRYGVSWQVVPEVLYEYLKCGDGEKVRRVTEAMVGMKKLDVEVFRRAFEGE